MPSRIRLDRTASGEADLDTEVPSTEPKDHLRVDELFLLLLQYSTLQRNSLHNGPSPQQEWRG